jgi:mono/diheme cytochrome c family protein
MKAPIHPAIRASSVIAVALVVALAGCRGERTNKPPRQFFPDLDNQPKYKAQEESEIFEDGRAMRPPVAGSVPFGAKGVAVSFGGVDFARRWEYLKDDRRIFEGKEPVLDADNKPVLETDGTVRERYLDVIPLEVSDELLALGEKKYNIYCIVCHGGTGDGKGTVGNRWSYPLPSFHAEQYQRGGEKGQDGYLFHTIRYGVPNVGEAVPYPLKMPSYASKISEKEAWAIVAYMRALQASQGSPINTVPERERMELERRRGVKPQAGASPTAADALASAGKEGAR